MIRLRAVAQRHELHRAHAEQGLDALGGLTRRLQRDGQPIQVLLAQQVRPPELRIRNPEAQQPAPLAPAADLPGEGILVSVEVLRTNRNLQLAVEGFRIGRVVHAQAHPRILQLHRGDEGMLQLDLGNHL